MALSLLGWIDGLTASGIVICGVIIGLYVIYEAKRNKAKLLLLLGLIFILSGLVFLGVFLDFMIVLATSNNMDNTYGTVGLLSYIWFAPLLPISMLMGAELLIHGKKRYSISVYIVLVVIFELLIFLNPLGSFNFGYPKKSGETLIDYNLVLTSPAGILFAILLFSVIFLGFGFLVKAIQSTSILRKKFLFLAIGAFLYFIFGFLEALTKPAFLLIIVRIGYITSPLVMYFGLREESEKEERKKPKKLVRVEGDLFRISQYKKEDITEEEVSISKEKKICLVCKSKAIGFNIFICPHCEAYYCGKCSQAIIELENMCWACNTPIDGSRPVKPFKKEVEEVDIEISEKHQKKPKIKK